MFVHSEPEVPPLFWYVLRDLQCVGSYPSNVSASLHHQASYFNMHRATWEPLLEPGTLTAQVRRKHAQCTHTRTC